MATRDAAWNVLTFSWLTGPILDKELRVSSRRRRTYVLRSVYIGALGVFVFVVFRDLTGTFSGSFGQMQMSRAAQSIVTSLVWFQFVAMQAAALILLSASFSEEIAKGTLALLLSAPISPRQIVYGKLCGKLLPIILLMGISVPLLAAIRLFGGIEWGYLLSSLCTTFTAVVFVGALSMRLSLHYRKTHTTVILAALTLGGLYVVLPILLMLMTDGAAAFLLIGIHPFGFLIWSTEKTFSSASRLPWLIGGIHWGFMLFLSGLVLRSCRLRLAGAVFEKFDFFTASCPSESIPASVDSPAIDRCPAAKPETEKKIPELVAVISDPYSTVRSVEGSPLIWKARMAPSLMQRHPLVTALLVIAAIHFVLFGYGMMGQEFKKGYSHLPFLVLYLCIGLGATGVAMATCITVEKESRTLIGLLTIPWSNARIVYDIMRGISRRFWPAWIPLFLHLLIFTVIGILRPYAIVGTSLNGLSCSAFLIGVSLYCSTRFRTSAAAILGSLAVVVGLWILLPFLIFPHLPFGWDSILPTVMNPFHQMKYVVTGAIEGYGPEFSFLFCLFAAYCLVQLLLGLLLVCGAARRLRKNAI
ncbi:MAG: ABC transporter permease subunit [Sedimentisphaerales bacterium]|nr:ABC transporter permease subunit [Sedimentisphaerales bacterium]